MHKWTTRRIRVRDEGLNSQNWRVTMGEVLEPDGLFAVHQNATSKHLYNLTHLPTGVKIPIKKELREHEDSSTLKEFAERLSELKEVPWSENDDKAIIAALKKSLRVSCPYNGVHSIWKAINTRVDKKTKKTID